MPGNMDERVVSMQFDNRQFEKNIKQSTESIDTLKKSLIFKDATKEAEELEKQFSKFGKSSAFKDIDKSMDSIKSHFSGATRESGNFLKTLKDITGLTAAIKIAESAVSSLHRAMSQFTTQPIRQGFAEYELKMGSIQTIMASTGASLETVNKYLDELNTYSDQTIYSFSDMTQNIGKFTNAGVKLGDAVAAIKGISNEAALSGANANEASRAMYNFAQALATGSIKLIDWKSIENANMATVEFKQNIIDTAVELGTLKKVIDKKGNISYYTQKGKKHSFNATKDFNTYLTDQWFTSAVLTKTLAKYADETTEVGKRATKAATEVKSFSMLLDTLKEALGSGWANTFENIFGNFEEGKELWTGLSDFFGAIIEESSKARNSVLKQWKVGFNGREDIFGKNGFLFSVLDAFKTLRSEFRSVFDDVFFPGLKQYMGAFDGLMGSAEYVDKYARNGLYTLEEIRQFRKSDFIAGGLKGITTQIKEFGLTIKNFFTKDENVQKFSKIFTAVLTTAKLFGTVISSIFSSIGGVLNKTGVIQDILDTVAAAAEKVQKVFNRIIESGFFTKLFEKIGGGIAWVYNLLKKWIGQISEFLEESGIGPAIRGFFNEILAFFIGSEKDVDSKGNKIESGFFRAFGWLEGVKAFFERLNFKTILEDVKMVFDNFGVIWNTLVGGLSGKDVDFEKLAKGGASSKLLTILQKVRDFGKGLSNAFQSIKGVADTVVGWLESSGILPTIRSFWDRISTFFGNIGLIWDKYINGNKIDPKDLDDKQKGLITRINKIIYNVRSVFDKVKSWFNTAFSWISEKWTAFTTWLETSGILPAVRSFGEKLSIFFGNIGLIWDKYINGNKIDPKDLNDKQKSLITKINKLIYKVRSAFDKIKKFLQPALDWITEKWTAFTGWLGKLNLGTGIKVLWKDIQNFFANIGMIWDIFVNKQGKYNPEDLTEDQLSIVQKIEGFIKTLQEKIEQIKQKFREIKDKVSGWLEESGIAGFFREAAATVSGWFGFGEPEQNADEGAQPNDRKNLNGNTKKDVKEAENKQSFISKVFGKLSEFGGKLFADFDTAYKNSDSLFGMVANVFVEAVNSIDDAFGKMHYGNIIKALKDFVGVFAGFLAAKTISDLLNTIRTIVNKGSGKTLEKFTKLLEQIGKMFLNIGITVALIAGSMWLISQIDPKRIGEVKGIMLAIGIFLASIIIIVGILNRFCNKSGKLDKTFKAVGEMLVAIGASILMIVISMIMISSWLSQLDADEMNGKGKMWTTFAIIGGILLVMVGVIATLAFITKKIGAVKMAVAFSAFAGMAVLLLAIAACLFIMDKIDSKKAVLSMLMLGGIILAIGKALQLMNNLKINKRVLAVLITFTVLVGIIALALIILSWQDPVKLGVAAAAFGGVLYILLAKCLPAINGIKINKSALNAVKILTLVVVVIAAALYFLSDKDWDKMLAAGGALGVVITALLTSMRALKGVKIPAGTYIAIAIMGGVIALIAGALWFLSDKDPNKLWVAALCLGGIVIALLISMRALKSVKIPAGTYITIAIMAGVIALIAGALYFLSDKDPNKLWVAALCLGGIVIALLIPMRALKGVKIPAGTYIAIAIMGGVIALIAGALWFLSDKDPNKLWVAALCLGGIVIALLISMRALKSVKIPAGTYITIAIMAGVIALIAGALYLLKDVDQGTMAVAAGSIAGVLLVLVAAIVILSKANINPIAMVKLGAGLAAFLLIIAATMWIIVQIGASAARTVVNTILYWTSTMAAASISAKNIDGEAIKRAFRLIVELSESISGLTDSTAEVKIALGFVQNVRTILNRLNLAYNSAKSINASAFEVIFGTDGKGGLLALINIGVGEVKSTGYAATLLARNMEVLTSNLVVAGSNGAKLLDGSENAKGIEAIKNRMRDIQEIVRMATSLSTNSDSGENVDLTAMSVGIANIGAALELYNIALAEAEEKALGIENSGKNVPLSTENIKTALTNLMEILPSSLPSPDDMNASSIEAWADLAKGDGDGGTKFALGLVNVAHAMTEFSNESKNFDLINSMKAICALDLLANIFTKVNGQEAAYGGMMESIGGWDPGSKSVPNSFAGAIVSMGSAMAEFGESVRNMPSDAVTNATNALDTLSTIYEKLKKDDNIEVFKFFTAENLRDLIFGKDAAEGDIATVFGDFGEGIGHLASALSSFGTAINGEETNFDADKVEAATRILESLSRMQIALRDSKIAEDNWWKTLINDENLETFGNNLAGLGSRLTEFSTSLDGFDLDTDEKTVGGKKWKNVTNVISFLSGITSELGAITNHYAVEAGGVETIFAAYNLKDISDVLQNYLGPAFKAFSEAMNTIVATEPNGKKSYRVGEWTKQQFENFKSLLNLLKEMQVSLWGNSIKKGEFYGLAEFGQDVNSIFTSLNSNTGDPSKSALLLFLDKFRGMKFDTKKEIDPFIGFLGQLRDLTIALKNAELIDGAFYNLDQFGADINNLFIHMLSDTDQISNSKLIKFMDEFKRKNYDFTGFVDFVTNMITASDTLNKAGLKEGSFYDLDALGHDINRLFWFFLGESGSINNSHIITFLDSFTSKKYSTYGFRIFLEAMAEITRMFGEAGLKENNFYDLEDLGRNLNDFFGYLADSDYGQENSNMFRFLDQFDGTTISVDGFASFCDAIKSVAEATATLHDKNIDEKDIGYMNTVLQALVDLNSSSLSNGDFTFNGINLATKFMTGFIEELTKVPTEQDTKSALTLDGAFLMLLSTIDSYSDDFLEKGRTAGQQFADGFNQGILGINNPTGALTPIVSMDTKGNTSTSGNGLAVLLSDLDLATSSSINEIAVRLDTLNGKFNTPINVTSSNTDVVVAVGTVAEKLKSIDNRISSLSSDLSKLKVYIDSKILVGSIAGEMDRELGRRANLRNVTGP